MAQSVRIVTRIRGGVPDHIKPFFFVENDENDKQTVIFPGEGESAKQFTFDAVLPSSATQAECYEAVMQRSVLDVLRGMNLCLLAYGQTGSGKTHSMSGTSADPGIIPRFAAQLFEVLSENKLHEATLVTVSYYELFNEKAYDLLTTERKPLRVRGTHEPYVESLTEVDVSSIEQFEHLRRTGCARRTTAAMILNEHSSRSHAVFMVTIRRQKATQKAVTLGKCFFVDLAGSEKISDDNSRQRESLCINKSLFALQRVIDARSSGASFIQYRDSVLTRLLQVCFSGDSKAAILANISPNPVFASETIRTFTFATKAATIMMQPKAHCDPENDDIEELRAANQRMRDENAAIVGELESLRLLIYGDVTAPCVVQLFDDDSMNSWQALAKDEKRELCDSLGNTRATILRAESGFQVNALAGDFFVNGEALANDEPRLLEHGDRLSISGILFFTILIHDDKNYRYYANYSKAKLEFIEHQFQLEHKRIVNDCLDDVSHAEKQFHDQVAEEVTDAQARIAELANMEAAAKTAHKRAEAAAERAETERYIREVKAMAASMAQELEAEKAQVVKYEMSDEDKQVLLDIRAKVQLLNGVVSKIAACKHYHFHAQLPKDDVYVRVFDKKKKLFACFGYGTFSEGYLAVSEAYDSGAMNRELTNVLENFIHAPTVVWRDSHLVGTSGIISNAVRRSIASLAKSRRSTINEVCTPFAGRESVLSRLVRQSVGVSLDTVLDQTLSTVTLTVPSVTPILQRLPVAVKIALEASELLGVLEPLKQFANIPPSAGQSQVLAMKYIIALRHVHALFALAGVLGEDLQESYPEFEFNVFESTLNKIFERIKGYTAARGTCADIIVTHLEADLASLFSQTGNVMFYRNLRPIDALLTVVDSLEEGFRRCVHSMTIECSRDVAKYRDSAPDDQRALILHSLAAMGQSLNELVHSEAFVQVPRDERTSVFFDVVRPIILIREECSFSPKNKILSHFDDLEQAIMTGLHKDRTVVPVKVMIVLHDAFTALAQFVAIHRENS